MNLVLVGYRGTGKSHVGRLLSGRLEMPYVSLDMAITSRARLTVPEIVTRHGWSGFRDRETAELRELAGWDRIIIDTGGGVVERPENQDLIRENGCVVWLRASVETIVSRIREDRGRPALTEGKSFIDEVAEVLERRTPLYRACARFEVETDLLAPGEVARRVAAFWREAGG
jgi:shikimate kinase